jgi:hypothetical protein
MDFSFRVEQSEARFVKSTPWERLNLFCNEWKKRSSDFSAVKRLWLELDIIKGKPRDPLIFFRCYDMGTVKKFISFFYPLEYSEKNISIVEHCIASISENVKILYLGLLHPRKSNAMRIYIEAKNAAALQKYLISINYPKNTIQRFIDAYLHMQKIFKTIICMVDINNKLLPTIAFDCKPDLDRKNTWTRTINHLVKNKMCPPKKGSLLLNWPGVVAMTHSEN